ncbi:FAD-dependent oxidoreductase [Sphingobium sp. DEHP117]|nr:FAD-dependent oxidoreductase [Sphingobium sp. DEHP117]
MAHYDLIVIGSGTAAQVAIGQVRAAGWSVAVIDHRPFGGTCALRGCDPKKMLVSGEEAIDAAARMAGHGVGGDLAIDWPSLMAFKRSFTDPVPAKQERRYAKLGVDAFHGLARFASPDAVAVDGRTLQAQHILIATGAGPIPLGIPGEELVSTSDAFLELETLPRRIVLIGGGYVAAEFSHLAARAGAEVTILQRASRLLPHFDPDLVGWLTPRFTALGIRIETGTAVTRVERNGDGLQVRASRQGAPDLEVACDLVIHAAGRRPDLGSLDLSTGQVAVQDGRLQLDAHLRSISNPRVYAAGDAAGVGPPLTPVSSHDAKNRRSRTLLHRSISASPTYRGVFRASPFTVPPIAAVGLSEEAARRSGLKFRVNAASTPDWFTARRSPSRSMATKCLIDERTDLVLGAHLVGPKADESDQPFRPGHPAHGLTSRGRFYAPPCLPIRPAPSDIGYSALEATAGRATIRHKCSPAGRAGKPLSPKVRDSTGAVAPPGDLRTPLTMAALLFGPPFRRGGGRRSLLGPPRRAASPGFAGLLHFISPLRVQPAARTGLFGRSRRPPPPRGGRCGFWAVLEAADGFLPRTPDWGWTVRICGRNG